MVRLNLVLPSGTATELPGPLMHGQALQRALIGFAKQGLSGRLSIRRYAYDIVPLLAHVLAVRWGIAVCQAAFTGTCPSDGADATQLLLNPLLCAYNILRDARVCYLVAAADVQLPAALFECRPVAGRLWRASPLCGG